jgi:hypothetical protein
MNGEKFSEAAARRKISGETGTENMNKKHGKKV